MSDNWIDLLKKETEEAETPRSYVYWAGLAAISAVIAPNTYLNRKGVYRLRPNLFVLLLGHSGLGKGLPIAIAKRLVNKVGATRVIGGRNTIQSIVKGLSEGEFEDSRGFIVSGEFATLLQKDPDAFTILTDLYDTQWNESWKNTTKFNGIEELVHPTVTIFGGSSLEHFREAVPLVNILGGFMGRTLLVYEEKRWRVNPLTDDTIDTEIDYEKLAAHLTVLAQLKGPFRKTEEANRYWEEWYTPFRLKEYDDKTGLVHRMPDHVLKTAMCVAMSRKHELVIDKQDLKEAIEVCLMLGLNTRRITKSEGLSAEGPRTRVILEHLFRSDEKKLTKQELLVRGYGDFDKYDLEKVAATLEDMKMVNIHYNGVSTVYELTKYAIEQFTEYAMQERATGLRLH